MAENTELVLTHDLLDELRNGFLADPVANLAMNACWKTNPIEMCIRRDKAYQTSHVFNHKVESEAKPVTHQKSSGRCWIFACLNAMRIPFMKNLNIEDFEFSQTYLFLWDKMERTNYFLNKMIECLRKGEEIEGRLVSYLLSDPTTDGGQWDMIVNLIEKYGLMPKKCYPETFCSENSRNLNRILSSKLREYTRDLHACILEESKGQSKVPELLEKQLKEIHRIISICLGVPPQKFTWEYYDKNKKFHSIGPVTPLEFYQKHVKPIYNMEDKVCLVNDPRPKNGFGRTFTIDCLGNMTGGRPVVYNNQPIGVLSAVASESLKAGEPVWFGSEVSKRFDAKMGVHDLSLHDYKSVFGVEVNLGMTKAERLIYGDSMMTHAMVFTGVSVEEGDKVSKWRVENSWGDDRGEKGYHVLSANWFEEFVFEVVVDKKYVPEEVMEAFKTVPVVLPAWDPMGSLARS